jgi:7-cyano-7-deazaguanine tRNA-ribosyltransferase
MVQCTSQAPTISVRKHGPSRKRLDLRLKTDSATPLAFSFEVKDTDLLGRVGVLKVGGRTLETPCLLPVIHPVNQAVPTHELKAMGFRGLMTNSYIIRSRRKEEALKSGIHEMLGFDGLFMTDSGGYQVLEYGDLEVSYGDVASFQAEIGSDLAVTLDRPTGYPQSRGSAEESVDHSLKNAIATLRDYGDTHTTWIGPIQGGLYLDLVTQSATALLEAGFGFLALGSPVQVMENYMFSDLVRMIIAARRPIPYSVPLHLFGAGHPLTMALAVALGCDTFDSASYILFARNGRYMSNGGVLSLDLMKYLPCSCSVCAKTSVKELREVEERERTKLVATHNLYVLREEVESCKEAISEGRLWDLVEEKSTVHPRLRDAFVELSKNRDLLVEGTPLLKDRGMMLRSQEDYGRPELASAQNRLRGAMKRASKDSVLLTAWDSVPIGKKSRQVAGSRTRPDTYRIHPALGVYPAELDFVYPFTQVVTSQDFESKMSVKEAVSRLRKLGYASVKVSPAGPPRRVATRRFRSRRTQRGASPSPQSSSARPRSPRRP